MSINYAQALRSTTDVQAAHSRQATEIRNAAKIHAWLQGLKTEVSVLLQAKAKLQNKLEELKKLQNSGYKGNNVSHLLEYSDHETLLVMIEDLEVTEQQQLEMVNECISLSKFMNELNQEIKEKESLIFKGAATLAEMNRQCKALEKSSANISFSLSDAIFKQFNESIVRKLKDKPIERASSINTRARSERLWMHYVDFTVRLCLKKVETAEKAIVKMKYVIDGLLTCDNFERLLPSIKEHISETQYVQELERYQSFKDEFIEKSIGTIDWAHRTFSSEEIDEIHQLSTRSSKSMLEFFSSILKKLQASDTSDLEKFELITAGAQTFIDAAFQCKPDLKKRQDISLSLFKCIFLERQKNMDEQKKQNQALESLKKSVERETFAYEKNQKYLKLLQANSQQMKQDLKKQAETFASETDKEISRTWLSLDDCKTEITALLNNKLVRRENNERGLFTSEAMNGVLNRHLMTEKQLKARLNKNEHLSAASSYKDEVALLEAVQNTVIPKFKQTDHFKEHLHLEHATPVEGWSLIRQESDIPLKKPITHSRVRFANMNSGWPLITHLYPCAD